MGVVQSERVLTPNSHNQRILQGILAKKGAYAINEAYAFQLLAAESKTEKANKQRSPRVRASFCYKLLNKQVVRLSGGDAGIRTLDPGFAQMRP